MTRRLTRRGVLLAGASLLLAGCAPSPDSGRAARPTPSPTPTATPVPEPEVRQLDLGDLPAGVYGVWGVLDGREVVHEPDARLRMCSTMKLPLAALALRESSRGALDLSSSLSWGAADLIGHSPFTREDPDRSATIAELCEAAARQSDNTAANLLIDAVGGLPALTAYARSLGDETTRFDRYETAMNIRSGDLDTTTAAAFGGLALSLAADLGPDGWRTLRSWLPGRDGRRIAAVAPEGLDLVHKTGTSGDGALNDVAFLLDGEAVAGVLAVFTDSPPGSEDVVAETARRALEALTAGR